MNVTGCNYGAHDFIRKPFDLPRLPDHHLHVCVECDATYIRACSPCLVPFPPKPAPAVTTTEPVAPGVCGGCGGPVPEPGLWLVPTPNGPRDACGQDCAHTLDRRTH